MFRAHSFVDGAYLRTRSQLAGKPWVDPRALAESVVLSDKVHSWCADTHTIRNMALGRVIYYDARTDDDTTADPRLLDYWRKIELLDDVELGFGSIRGGTTRKPPRQKGVDTLIAVDMLVGAFTGLFDVAVLIAGDADFVPVVNEVRRRGVMVAVGAASDGSLSDDLLRAADRCYLFDPSGPPHLFPSMPGF
jgi:uncharacterized LabA/DUF88 family protein